MQTLAAAAEQAHRSGVALSIDHPSRVRVSIEGDVALAFPATMPEEKVGSFGQDTPLGRAGQPAELAPAYVFLASQEASYITSEVIAVTGGTPF